MGLKQLHTFCICISSAPRMVALRSACAGVMPQFTMVTSCHIPLECAHVGAERDLHASLQRAPESVLFSLSDLQVSNARKPPHSRGSATRQGFGKK